MWTIQKQNNQWYAEYYKTGLNNNKIVKNVQSYSKGSQEDMMRFMLSFEDIEIDELVIAISELEFSDKDTAFFGLFGGFLYATKEQKENVWVK